MIEGMIPEAITRSSIGTAAFRPSTSTGCRPANCMTTSTLLRYHRPVWASVKWRMSALIPIPGVTCTVALRSVAPGAIRRAPFPPAMTRCGRTRRVTSGGSAVASGGGSPEWNTMYGKRWSVEQVSQQVEGARPVGAALLLRFAAGIGARAIADADVAGGATGSIPDGSEEWA